MEKILIVDDEQEVAELLEELLTQFGYATAMAFTKAEAVDRLKDFSPGIVLLDIRLPDGDGISILKEIKATYPAIEVIMITGLADRDIALQALKEGAADYICKPIDLDYLANSVLAKVVTRFDMDAPVS
ncbi:MAG: response regulator [Candidatus Marinimicrobia bacterium]|jgi:DNA-binding NtrC family response regulator|nr:response regulator [Candidatus Neomarinimicrobiota bacterium]MCK9560807.1 response regulator [Candidatus Neomarinimicrobiota bacterium]MDD5061426.1 response regulator [Candidatus Neomarinimicrobiota bacterium]MDD5229796.1 response regulator [Candidatus Neomarinimicrobiota bacterium]MDD5540213.1 response regulator [Candidatus Neomarinimicrobiota bacterium]